jgi:hypothetical protein
MRSYPTILLLLFALAAGIAPTASAQAPLPGDCQLGTAERDLDVNNVLARVFNTGSLFYGNTTTAGDGYLVPQASGNSPIFASGIWIGGEVDGDLRLAGSTYSDFEFWPGPLNDDGTLPNPSGCSEFDRIYKVSRTDILAFEGGQPPSADLAAWPAELGAPVIAAPDNAFDDDGDGLTDEGTDGIDNDGDGFADERDEQERVVVAVREAAGRPVYDLDAGDRPEIVGDQALWWVMNDVGNTHTNNLTPPIGIEVQVLAFSFARADALNDVTFYRYTVIKKSPGVINDVFFSIFSDPDLGDATDDFVGVDTTLSLAYVYNGADVDANYGVPPAAGYDFFQGPIVDGDTLGVTRFNYFSNIGGADPTSDPTGGEDYYNYMQGLWRDGVPMTVGGTGYQTDGEVTLFAFPGDPVENEFWSEVNTDGSGAANTPGDRRFLVTTGPFDLNQGDSQVVVYGVVFGQGSDRFDSITQLRINDRVAQTAYDIDFELASAPPPPPRCSAASTDPQLQPGSGNCLEAIETDEAAALVWGYPTNSPNYLGRYEILDRLLAGTNVPDSTYNFEAFNIYRYPSSNFSDVNRELLATYDVINGVTMVVDTVRDVVTQTDIPFLAFDGEDTGIQYSYDLTDLGLTNYQDYYFGITALAYSQFSIPKIIESAASTITVRPSKTIAGGGGSVVNSDIGDLIIGERTSGAGAGNIGVRVVDPTQLTGQDYAVEVLEIDTGAPRPDSLATVFRILRDGNVVFSGEEAFSDFPTEIDSTSLIIGPFDQRIVIDGIEFFVVEDPEVPSAFASDADETANYAGLTSSLRVAFDVEGQDEPDFSNVAIDIANGIVETANPNADVCTENSLDIGCQYPEYLGGNTVWLSPNSTESYILTTPSNDLGTLTSVITAAAPDDYEIRFTDECAASGGCFGLSIEGLGDLRFGRGTVVSVPFEIVNVGYAQAGFEDDDIRMIPLILPEAGGTATNWSDTFPTEQNVIFSTRQRVTIDDEQVIETRLDSLSLPVSLPVAGLMPDRPNGYELFADAASGFGIGNVYDPETDGDEQIDIVPFGDRANTACRIQGYYADFCYKGLSDIIVRPVGGSEGVVFADYDMDGETPPPGTIVRFVTSPKPGVRPGDRVVFDTRELAFQTDQQAAAEEALDLIGIVPNPYMGVSAYETDNLDRIVRFINMPERATISIYTVAGTLIRTLQKEGPSRSLDWDLNTHNQLPVASGMYLIHVDVPGVGEKVLKFGVVNRKNRITVF